MLRKVLVLTTWSCWLPVYLAELLTCGLLAVCMHSLLVHLEGCQWQVCWLPVCIAGCWMRTWWLYVRIAGCWSLICWLFECIADCIILWLVLLPIDMYLLAVCLHTGSWLSMAGLLAACLHSWLSRLVYWLFICKVGCHRLVCRLLVCIVGCQWLVCCCMSA